MKYRNKKIITIFCHGTGSYRRSSLTDIVELLSLTIQGKEIVPTGHRGGELQGTHVVCEGPGIEDMSMKPGLVNQLYGSGGLSVGKKDVHLPPAVDSGGRALNLNRLGRKKRRSLWLHLHLGCLVCLNIILKGGI